MTYQPPVVGAIGNLQGSGLLQSSAVAGFTPGPHFEQPYAGMNQAAPNPQDSMQMSEEAGENEGQTSQQGQMLALLEAITELTQELQQQQAQGQDASQVSQELQNDVQQLQSMMGGSGMPAGYGMDPSMSGGGGSPVGYSGGGGAPASGDSGSTGGGGSSPSTDGGSSADASSTPQTSAAASGDAKANAQIVAEEARKMGVDPTTAVATMLTESGGNSHAVGDGGTSFGLFQLHQGGELGNRTEQQAFDPKTNADVALSVFAQNKGRYSDPGQLAAASQRPANPQAYARTVDSHLSQARQLLGAA